VKKSCREAYSEGKYEIRSIRCHKVSGTIENAVRQKYRTAKGLRSGFYHSLLKGFSGFSVGSVFLNGGNVSHHGCTSHDTFFSLRWWGRVRCPILGGPMTTPQSVVSGPWLMRRPSLGHSTTDSPKEPLEVTQDTIALSSSPTVPRMQRKTTPFQSKNLFYTAPLYLSQFDPEPARKTLSRRLNNHSGKVT
jgi:hypothetical protein